MTYDGPFADPSLHIRSMAALRAALSCRLDAPPVTPPQETTVSEPKPILARPTIRGSMALTPGGIECFATLMHVLFAHVHNPSKVGDGEHHKAAHEYILAHQRKTSVDRVSADASSASYIIGYPGREPISVRILIGKPADRCLEVLAGNGSWVPIDFRSFDVTHGIR